MLILFTDKKIPSEKFINAAKSAFCRLRGIADRPSPIIRENKPRFQEGFPEFSLSHSGKYTVCAMSEKAVGADIQEIKPIDYKAIAERFSFPENLGLEGVIDEYCKREARAKNKNIPLFRALKEESRARLFRLFPDTRLAVESDDEVIFLQEYRGK